VTHQRLLACVSLALVLSNGCGASPDRDKTLATVRSWTATARLAADGRRAGATTAAFTSQLGERARKALEEARISLGEAGEHAQARQALDSLAQMIHRLDRELRGE
jgi:C4-dicarboxylate-specific signal transduction histidine kinase